MDLLTASTFRMFEKKIANQEKAIKALQVEVAKLKTKHQSLQAKIDTEV